MKILQINKLYFPWIGGVETVVRDIADGLRGKDGVFVENLVCRPRGKRVIETVHDIKTYRAASFGIFFGMPISFDFFILFRKLVQDTDIILIHHPFPLAAIAYWLFGRNKKLVVWYHSDIIKQKITKLPFLPFIHYILRRASFIFVSNSTLIKTSRELQKFSSKCRVIYFGIDETHFIKTEAVQRQADDIRLRFGVPLLLSVGRLVYYKGFSYLIEAMRLIDANLLIIGDGPLELSLRQQIRNSGLESRVFIISSVDNLVPYYYACDIFILASSESSEAFGIVQIEAMACGKPVINTALPTGVPEVSVNKKTGLTVSPKQPRDLTEAINLLLFDGDMYEKFSHYAKDEVTSRFTKKIFISRILDFLSQLYKE